MPGYLLSWLCAGKKEGKEGGLKEKYGAGGGGSRGSRRVPGVEAGLLAQARQRRIWWEEGGRGKNRLTEVCVRAGNVDTAL